MNEDTNTADDALQQAAAKAEAMLRERPLSEATVEAAAALLMAATLRSFGADDAARVEFIEDALDGHCPVCGQLMDDEQAACTHEKRRA